jgi:hypothetical protein
MIKPFAMQTIALIASLALARAPSVPSLSKTPKPYNHYEEELVSTQSYRGSSSSFLNLPLSEEVMRKTLFILILSLFSIALFATDVSGSQSGVWSLANSPYHIVGDIEVPEGTTLQIEPGVTVIAMGNFRLNALGTINAVGTPADSIRFESGMNDPDDLWKGIRITNPTQASTFTHLYVEKAEMGINCLDSPATISHCRFYKNEKGIRLYGMGNLNPAAMDVHDNIVEYSIENGILIHQNSNAHVHHNEIRYNGTGTRFYAAIQLSNQSGSGSNSPEINHNHIHHNFKQGISAWDITSSGTAIAPHIHHNLIENNLTGIYLLYASGFVEENIIRNNFIAGDANSGAGVMVAGSTSEPYFKLNEVYGNFCGFYLGNNAKPVLGDLASNHIWAGGGNQIYNNIDGSNIPHSVFCFSYTDATIVIKAENNYWGTNDPALIDNDITDQLDDPALPLVDYDPWMDSPPQNTSIVGTFTDPLNITNSGLCMLYIVGAQSGIIHHSFDTEIDIPFNLYFELDESFYVIGTTDGAQGTGIILTAAGSLAQPTVFEPDMEHQLGDISFGADQTLPSKQYVGEPIQVGGRNIYPVYGSFYVFAPDGIQWMYDEGDYRYIHAITTLNEHGETVSEFTFPANSIYTKIHNLQPYDTWMRTNHLIDNETYTTTLSYLILEDGTTADRLPIPVLLETNTETGRIVRRSEFDAENAVTYFFESDGYITHRQHCNAEAFNIPLQTGQEAVRYLSRYLDTFTNNLYYDHTRYLEDHILNLYWLAPDKDRVHEWTHYNIYADDALVASTDDFSPFYSLANPLQGATYTVKASDGTNEGETDTYLWVPTVSNDDPIMPPTTLSIYPNPFTGGRINIKLDDPKRQSGSFSVYNLRGQKVYTQDFAKGEGAELSWSGKDQKGRNCGSGIYLLKVNLRDGRGFTKRMVKM